MTNRHFTKEKAHDTPTSGVSGTQSKIFDSDSTPAFAEYTPPRLRNIWKFCTSNSAQTPNWTP